MKYLILIASMIAASPLVSQENNDLAWNRKSKGSINYTKSNQLQSSNCKPTPYYYSKDQSYGYTFGEWIYWKAVTGDPMNWEMRRLSNYNGNAAPETEDIEKRMVTSKYDFSSGFKIGAGVRFKQSAWESSIPAWQFEATLTHIFSKSHFADQALGEVADEGNRFVEQFLRPLQYLEIADFDNSSGIDMKGTLSLSHTRLDGLFAWPIWIQENLILRLMTGPSIAWFNNRWTTYIKERSSPSSSVNRDDLFMQWQWKGGGIMGGGDIYLPLGAGVGIFTNSSFALMMGPMTLTEVDDAISPGNDPDREITNTEYSYYTFQPTVSLELGTDYKKWICDVVMLHASVSWEYNWWFDLNQFGDGYTADYLVWIEDGSPQAGENFIMDSNGLGYHGLNFRLGLDF